jgi:hypothetical protein
VWNISANSFERTINPGIRLNPTGIHINSNDDGKWIAMSDENTTVMCDMVTANAVRCESLPSFSRWAVSPDGKRIVTEAWGTINVWKFDELVKHKKTPEK